MSMHDLAILFAAVAGLCMVIGGMLLIWKGAIVLASTDANTALSIEWKKDFKLSTQAPGIAFFILGLSFSCIAIYASDPKPTDPVYIKGSFDNIDELVTITAVPIHWEVTSGSDGIVDGKFTPDTEILTLKFTAPGYEVKTLSRKIENKNNRTILFERPIQLKKTAITKIEPKTENIVTASSSLAAIDSPPKFGGGQ